MKLHKHVCIFFLICIFILLSPVISYARSSPPELVPEISPSKPKSSIWNIESRRNIIKLNVSFPVVDLIFSNLEMSYVSHKIYMSYERAINHWLSVNGLVFFPYSASFIHVGGAIIPRIYFAHWWRVSTFQGPAANKDSNAGTISGPYMGFPVGYTFYTGTYNKKDIAGSEINFGANLGWQFVFNKGLTLDLFTYYTYNVHLTGDNMDGLVFPISVFLGYAF